MFKAETLRQLLSDDLLSILFSTKASFLYDVSWSSLSTRCEVSAVFSTTRFLLQSGRPHHSKVFKLLLNGTPCKLFTIGLKQELNIRSRITCWTTGQSFSTNWTGEEELRCCLGSRLRYKSYWWWKPFGWLFSYWKWRRLCI